MAETAKPKRKMLKKIATESRNFSKNMQSGVKNETKKAVLKTAKKAGDSKKTKTYLKSSY